MNMLSSCYGPAGYLLTAFTGLRVFLYIDRLYIGHCVCTCVRTLSQHKHTVVCILELKQRIKARGAF